MAGITLNKQQMAIYLLIRDHGMSTEDIFDHISPVVDKEDYPALRADISRIEKAVENTIKMKQQRSIQ